MSDLAIQQQDAKELGRHYTWKKQLLEVCSVLVFGALMLVMLERLARVESRPPAWVLVAVFAFSMVVADLVSGIVHWLADTWGTVEIPILGPTLIKNFREHHSDPKALTRKGLVETNGDNCMILIPAQVGALFMPIADGSVAWVVLYTFVLSFTFWIMVTNQFHKWAHFEEHELSMPLRFLMRLHLILPWWEHRIHHTVPFESHYCITNGWLNGPLRWLGFYRKLEWLGWRIFGAIPRENDIGTDAAVALAIRQGILPPDFKPTRQVAGTRSTPVAG